MNKVIVVFLLVLGYNFTFAQEKVKKNELSISMLKISTSPFYNTVAGKPFKLNAGVHVIYKHRLRDNLFLRASQSYYKYSNPNNLYGFEKSRNMEEIMTSAGVEFRYFPSKKKQFNLYTGADLSVFLYKNKLQTETDNIHLETMKGAGLNTFAGINIYPAKKLIISIESSLLLGFSRNSIVSTNLNGSSSVIFEPNFEMFGQIFLLRTVSVGWRF